jgi:septum site-determining protein MinC
VHNSDPASLSLKATLAPLTTLSVAGLELDQVREVLARKKAEAPALFNRLPCVLDLGGVDADAMSLEALHQVCVDCGLLPIAAQNVTPVWQESLTALHMADLGAGGSRRGETAAAAPQRPPETRALRVHTGNIRSGQQFHFDGDLIIQGAINPGAEVLATGDIHVYGLVRGRVLAGIKGDDSAVIACQQFDPELLAIAGQYRLFEDAHPHRNQPVVARLDGDSLNLVSIS